MESTNAPSGEQAAVEMRVGDVYNMILAGATRRDILKYAKKKEWGVKDRQIDTYIKRARQEIRKRARFQRDYEFGLAYSQLEDLYKRSANVADYKTALAARRELNKLLSLYLEPAARTLKLIGLDEAQLTRLMEAINEAGMKPSALFEAMLNEFATTGAKDSEAGD